MSAAAWRIAASRPWRCAHSFLERHVAGQVRRKRRHAERAHDRQLVRQGRAPAAPAPPRARPPPAWPRSARRCRCLRLRGPAPPAGARSRASASTGSPGCALPVGERSPGAFQHLERAHDALRIGRHQARRHLRIARAQDGMQLRRRPLRSLGAPVGAHVGIDGRHRREALQQHLEVEARCRRRRWARARCLRASAMARAASTA